MVCAIRLSLVAVVRFAMETSNDAVEVEVDVDDAKNTAAGTRVLVLTGVEHLGYLTTAWMEGTTRTAESTSCGAASCGEDAAGVAKVVGDLP